MSQRNLTCLAISSFVLFLSAQGSLASDVKNQVTIQDYFNDSLNRLKVKECTSSQEDQGPWPLKRVFIKVKPQIGVGINRVLSLTAIPQIGFAFERVDGAR